MLTSLLLSLEEGSGTGIDILKLLGRLHPAMVHYPIALITVAAALEGWQIFKKRPAPASATGLCVLLGALSAILASLFGWFNDEFEGGGGGDLVELHKWLGLGATAVTMTAAGMWFKADSCPWARVGLRLSILGGALLISATGFFGGELVFDKGHLTRGLFGAKKTPPVPITPVGTTPDKDPLLLPAGNLDFAKEVAPVITKLCLRCHGGDKVKGKLNLKTREGFLKGGEGGKVVVPGKPKDSPLYTSMLESDPEVKMPPPKEKVQPSKSDIELIHKWIEQGADWPAGVELK